VTKKRLMLMSSSFSQSNSDSVVLVHDLRKACEHSAQCVLPDGIAANGHQEQIAVIIKCDTTWLC